METKRKLIARYLQDAIMLLIVGGLFCCGASGQIFWRFSDVAHYQCYAVAFWRGWSELQRLPVWQCAFMAHPDKDLAIRSQSELLHAIQQWRLPSGLIQFIAAQSPYQLYHSLPYEYPGLMLLPFSLALIVPTHWYQVAFALEMFLVVGCIYFVLRCWRSRRAALLYLLYLLVGSVSTVLTRFDIIPAALTLFAVICVVQKRWNWAFVLLALATMSKVYPVILLVPFLLALQQGTSGKWYAWHKWLPIGIFAGICALVVTMSALLSVAGTLAPLDYFSNRPVEVESLSASILWLLGKNSLTYINAFDALSVLSPLASHVTIFLTVLMVVSLLYTWWLQWRGRIDLKMACLLTLLILIITGKVFSPQYLIWVFPLVAYIEQDNYCWLLFWVLIGFLTTWIYPLIFSMTLNFLLIPFIPEFYPVTMLRNFLLLGFILFMLIWSSCQSHPLSYDKEQAEYRKQGSESARRKDLIEV